MALRCLKIVSSGKHEPSAEEADWPSDQEEENTEEKVASGVAEITLKDYDKNTPGIPKFWLHDEINDKRSEVIR